VKIHRDKLPDEIKRKIKNDDWIGVNSLFADFYLTLLATHISENIGAALLTNVAAPNKLGTQVKLDAQSNSLINASTSRKRPVNLAQGTLADVIFKNIQIDDNTQVDDILEFRDRHKCELGRFRTRIAKLTDTIQGYQSLTELRQHAEDIYTCQVAPAIASLKEGLEDCRIDYRWNGFLNVTAIGTSLHEFIGIPCHQALLAGSGISFVVSTILYTREKARILRDNPYSYLLAVNEEFGK
jgi:hypothetical protein